jgi:A/G-specific adenine glycosylase
MARVLTKRHVNAFREEIYHYYESHGRHDLPWRKTRNPYRILVSEVMLQQTQVSRVSEKYIEFIRKFPSPRRLARAPLREVLRTWSGLGYNRRALALKRLAQTLVEEYGGGIPHNLDELRTLLGIGNATASAILTFAFNEPTIFLETNVRTVFIAFFFKRKRKVQDKEILPFIEETLDRHSPREWYFALMDYGAMLKRRHNPSLKSIHHRTQGAFAGSTRQARGAIVHVLTEKSFSLEEIVGVGKRTKKETEIILARLVKEGFLKKRRGKFLLAT